MAYLGDNLYEFTLRLNRHINHWRGRLGLPSWSLLAYLKFKMKKAVMYVNDFEEAVARAAQRAGHDDVVCGHIHRAEIRDINGVLYCNDGDWVESCSALVEHHDGQLEVVHWAASVNSRPAPLPAHQGQPAFAPHMAEPTVSQCSHT